MLLLNKTNGDVWINLVLEGQYFAFHSILYGMQKNDFIERGVVA